MDTDGYPLPFYPDVTVYSPSIGVIFALVGAVLLLGASAFMSGSETALFSLSPGQIDEIKSRKHPADKALSSILDDSDRLLASILIGNNFVNVAIVMLFNFIFEELFDFSQAPTVGFLVQVVLLTFLLLLFGEILPKIYCQPRALKLSRKVATPMSGVVKVLRPFTTLLVGFGSLITGLVQKKRFALTAADLTKAIELTTDKEEEQGMLNEIIKFYSKTASEVMTPRLDIAALEYDSSYDNVLSFVKEHGYSRIPVYEDRIDTVKGLLYAKDLLSHLDEPADFEWQKLLRPVFYVPETNKVDALLESFREQKIHMAIVVDEYGGTSGLVTMEDLLEEVLGEISDEYDEEDSLYHPEEDGTFIFDAKISLVDFLRIVKLEDEEEAIIDAIEEVDTLSGLLLEVKGDFPSVGEVIHVGNSEFTILEMGRHRISKVLFRYIPKSEPEGE